MFLGYPGGVKHPPPPNRNFREEILRENLGRLGALAVVGSAINLAVLLATPADGWVTPTSVTRIAWMGAAFVCVLATTALKRTRELPPVATWVVTGGAALSLLFSAMLTTLVSPSTGFSYVLVINLLLTGMFLTFPPGQLLLLTRQFDSRFLI